MKHWITNTLDKIKMSSETNNQGVSLKYNQGAKGSAKMVKHGG